MKPKTHITTTKSLRVSCAPGTDVVLIELITGSPYAAQVLAEDLNDRLNAGEYIFVSKKKKAATT